MTYPTVAVEVAFDDDPLDTTVTWTAITSHVRSIRTTVGRDTELAGFEPGTCTLVLDNTNRLFDPLHTAGTYYGKLTAGKRVRVTATHDAATHTLFVGWVDGWPQDFGNPAPTITVRCTDAFKQLARMTLPGSVYEAVVLADHPWAWYRLRELTGTTWSDSSGNNREATVRFPTDLQLVNVDANGLLPYVPDEVAISKDGSPFFDAEVTPPALGVVAPYTIGVWWRGMDAATVDDYGASILYDLDSGLHLEVGDWADDTYKKRLRATWSGGQERSTDDVCNDGAVHYLAVRVNDAGVVRLYVDGVWIASATTGGPAPIPSRPRWIIGPGATASTGLDYVPATWHLGEIVFFDELLTDAQLLEQYEAAVAPWDGDTTGARIDRVLDAFSWPAGLKDIATGQGSLGPARLDGRSALEYLQSVAAAEQGHLYCDPANSGKVTFRDRHHRLTTSRSTAVQYVLSDEDTGGVYHYDDLDLRYDEQDIINVAEVKWQGGIVTVENAVSVTTYGRSTRRIDTELATRSEAENLGDWVIGRYATPMARCRKVTLNPAAYQAAFVPALNLRIGDRVTVRKHPQAIGSAIDKDVLVEGIEHTIDRGVDTWTTVVKTSEAEAGPWFVWDTATWDETTRWAW